MELDYSKTMKISAKHLTKLKACNEQVQEFKKLFGDSTVEITKELCLKHAQVFNWNWAAMNLLTKDGYEAYLAAGNSAFKAYLAAIESDGKAYLAATNSAFKAAIESAEKAYQAATEPDGKVYLAAIEPDGKVYLAAKDSFL